MSGNSFSNFLVFLIVVAVIYYSYRFFTKNRQIPQKTYFRLPKKIYFDRKTDDKYHLGTFAADVLTIGGHGRLKKAKYAYEEAYSEYAVNFNYSIDIRQNINDNLNKIGEITYHIFNELEKSQKMLALPAKSGFNDLTVDLFNNNFSRVYEIKNIAEEKSGTGVALLQGGAVGGLAAVGTWTFVATFGTASTGTAIATLSGAAAHNAILASIGGGALAAGGGGMAAGTALLGVMIAAPIVVFSSYKTHKSANELEEKVQDINIESQKVSQVNNNLLNIQQATDDYAHYLHGKFQKINEINHEVEKLIYPNGVFSKAKRSIKEVFNQDFYTREEAEGIDRLLKAVSDITDDLEQNQPNKHQQISYIK